MQPSRLAQLASRPVLARVDAPATELVAPRAPTPQAQSLSSAAKTANAANAANAACTAALQVTVRAALLAAQRACAASAKRAASKGSNPSTSKALIQKRGRRVCDRLRTPRPMTLAAAPNVARRVPVAWPAAQLGPSGWEPVQPAQPAQPEAAAASPVSGRASPEPRRVVAAVAQLPQLPQLPQPAGPRGPASVAPTIAVVLPLPQAVAHANARPTEQPDLAGNVRLQRPRYARPEVRETYASDRIRNELLQGRPGAPACDFEHAGLRFELPVVLDALRWLSGGFYLKRRNLGRMVEAARLPCAVAALALCGPSATAAPAAPARSRGVLGLLLHDLLAPNAACGTDEGLGNMTCRRRSVWRGAHARGSLPEVDSRHAMRLLLDPATGRADPVLERTRAKALLEALRGFALPGPGRPDAVAAREYSAAAAVVVLAQACGLAAALKGVGGSWVVLERLLRESLARDAENVLGYYRQSALAQAPDLGGVLHVFQQLAVQLCAPDVRESAARLMDRTARRVAHDVLEAVAGVFFCHAQDFERNPGALLKLACEHAAHLLSADEAMGRRAGGTAALFAAIQPELGPGAPSWERGARVRYFLTLPRGSRFEMVLEALAEQFCTGPLLGPHAPRATAQAMLRATAAALLHDAAESRARLPGSSTTAYEPERVFRFVEAALVYGPAFEARGAHALHEDLVSVVGRLGLVRADHALCAARNRAYKSHGLDVPYQHERMLVRALRMDLPLEEPCESDIGLLRSAWESYFGQMRVAHARGSLSPWARARADCMGSVSSEEHSSVAARLGAAAQCLQSVHSLRGGVLGYSLALPLPQSVITGEGPRVQNFVFAQEPGAASAGGADSVRTS